MAVVIRKKRRRALLILGVLLLIGFCILGYFQLLYKAQRVDTGLASRQIVFNKHRHIVTSIRFNPNDSLIVTSSVDSTIRTWKRESGEIVKEIKHPTGVAYMDVSDDGNFIISGGYDAKVRIWNAHDGSLIREFGGHEGTVWHVAISKDGSKIASGGNDGSVNIWDMKTGNLLHKLQGHKRIVWSVKFSPDGTQLASASFDFTFKIWDVGDGKLLWDNKDHTETVVDLAYSHDGRLLASTSDDKTIRLWNVAEHKLFRSMKVPEHVQAVAFSPDDKRLITGGRDKPMIGEFLQEVFGNSKFNPGVSARLWDVEKGSLLQTFTSHANDVMDVAYSHDGKWIATASADRTAELWKLAR